MKKRILSLFLILCLILTMTQAVFAGSGNDEMTIDGLKYQITGNNTVEVSGVDGSPESVTIPDHVTYNETTYTVAGIGAGAFNSSDTANALQSVTMPENSPGFTYISGQAFANCHEITSLTIPASVTSIGSSGTMGAFYDMTGLETVTFAEGSKLEDLGPNTFSGCTSLQTLVLPEGLKMVSGNIVVGCTSLGSVTIPSSVTHLDPDAFCMTNSNGTRTYHNISKFTIASGGTYTLANGVLYTTDAIVKVFEASGDVVIPEGIKSIGESAFVMQEGLTSVTIPDSVTSIGEGAFGGCAALKTVNFSGESSLSAIPAAAFYGCSSLTSITVPEGVTEIGDMAFAGCTGLETAVLPDGLETIGTYAFALTTIDDEFGLPLYNDAPQLKFINIPASVSSLGVGFLCGVGEDTVVLFQGTELPDFETSAFGDGSDITLDSLTFLYENGITTELYGEENGELTLEKPFICYPAGAANVYAGSGSALLEAGLVTAPPAGGEGDAQPEQGYALSMDTSASVETGKTVTPASTVTLPDGADLTWSSSDPTIAEVTDGTVTGLKAGTAVVTASIELNGVTLVSADCTITVTSSGSTGSLPTVPAIQKPIIEASEGVTVDLNNTGTIAAITVADGYELADVTVNGVSKGAVTTLTGLKTGDKVVVTARKIETADDQAALIEAVKNTRLVARSMYAAAPSGKKAIKVYWFNKDGSELNFDGYEVYRSLKRNSGYGTKPIFKTTKERYFNTAIKKGNKYYYKVRGYKVIGGQKVYTPYSLKAWRIAK